MPAAAFLSFRWPFSRVASRIIRDLSLQDKVLLLENRGFAIFADVAEPSIFSVKVAGFTSC